MSKLKIVCFLLCVSLSLMSQRVTVSGFVTDSLSGETIISGSVHEKSTNVGTFTNNYGFFSLEIPKGKSTLAISYMGYKTLVMELDIEKDSVLNLKMASKSLKEVVVKGQLDQTGVHGVHMSAVTISMDKVNSLPAIMGESDVVKTLQLLPGVKGGTEGSSGMYVRGGRVDQNLYLLDGAPLYNVNHAFGFFSAFDANAIKNVTLYKGDFPARFGGRLSSVVDVRLKEGNNSRLHGNLSIGLISTKAFLEGPLLNKNTTFAISGRRTYFDLLLQPIIRSVSSYSSGTPVTAGYFFYDLSAKVTHRFSNNDNVSIVGYSGDDITYAKSKVSLGGSNLQWSWGNLVGAVKWNHVVNNKLFVNTAVGYTRYRFQMLLESISNKDLPEEMSQKLMFNTGIHDWNGKVDFDYSLNHNHSVKFGTNLIYHKFIPSISSSQRKVEGVEYKADFGSNVITSFETMTYCEDNFTINDRLSLNVGLHHSLFDVQSHVYNSLQPRTSFRYLLADDLSFKGAYSYMTQYIHLLSNNNISFPTDLWVPTTKRVAPLNSQQVACGFFYNLLNKFDVSLEGYYKTMDNLVEYKDGEGFSNFGENASSSWEDKVVQGKGWSYGVELLIKKDIGMTSGWIGYTWAKAERLFNRPGQELNNGLAFPDRFDIRHSVSLVLTHKFSDNFDVGAVWMYSTGKAGSLAMQNFPLEPISTQSNNTIYGNSSGYYNYGNTGGYVSSRNNYRFDDYHRLDLSFNWHKKKKWGVRTWSVQIYNVYNRLNPDYVFPDPNNQQGPQLKKITIIPFFPSATYSFEF